MAAMVIVNNGGDGDHVYAPLKHAPWHGWTPTDLIFPFFLFMVGLSITLSRKTGSWAGIARRTLVLLGIGLFLNAYPKFDFAHLRWLGVLPRIALCYGATASIVKLFGYERMTTADDRRALARGLGIVIAVLLLGYWAAMMLVPGASGIAGDLSQAGNLASRIDLALMPGHTYRPTYDPEGLLSTLPAIGTTLIGVLAGLWLKSGATIARRSGGFLAAGALLIAAGLVWDVWFPINKALWTSSYVLFTAGAASLIFGGCLWLIDAKGYRAWTGPFVILGRNALALFVLSSLLAKTLSAIPLATAEGPMSLRTWVYRHGFAPLAAPINASLLYAVANLAVLFVVLWGLHKKGLWLRV